MLDDSLEGKRKRKLMNFCSFEIDKPCISCIFLERKTVDGNFLAVNTAEQILYDHLSKTFTLPIINFNNL